MFRWNLLPFFSGAALASSVLTIPFPAVAQANQPVEPMQLEFRQSNDEPLVAPTNDEPLVAPLVPAVPPVPVETLDFNDPSLSPVDQNVLTDYVLGPGDQISILVLGYDEFTGARVVLPDGTITMPLIGSVPAAGRTLGALSSDVEGRLKVYLTDPVVDANLTVLRPVVVNIAGEVYRPGPVQLSSLTQVTTQVSDTANITSATNTPTLSSALTAAGGIRRTADVRNILVKRRLPNGQTTEFKINLWDILVTGSTPGVVVLADGDSVYVPIAQAGELLDPKLLASSTFAPTNVRVRVVGEVKQPGEVTVQPNSSVSSAVAAAGGPTDDAQLGNVTLVRLNETGQVEKQSIDLNNLIDNYQIQDGDVVLVSKKGYLNTLDNVARFLNPLLIPVNLLNLFNIIGD